MTIDSNWELPEGIDELLPAQAAQVEMTRRTLLDHFERCGFAQVMPPMVEFLDALLTGSAKRLALQTFKITDVGTGRTLGVRADMTPQVARMDSHSLKSEEINRLCYIGSVLRTQARGFASSRSPMQVGAEIFGHDGIHSDAEIMVLMIETLRLAGISQTITLDIGHVGVFHALCDAACLSSENKETFYDLIYRKAKPELEAFVERLNVDVPIKRAMNSLVESAGDPEAVFERASHSLAGVPAALEAVTAIAQTLKQVTLRTNDVDIHVDLGELRGYRYHTGIVFGAFAHGWGEEIARGGRYNNIGEAFGHCRPATGFSTDLKTLLAVSDTPVSSPTRAIALSSKQADAAAWAKVNALRAQGETVITYFDNIDYALCNRELIKHGQDWSVESL